ncbi:DegV family protein [Nesterenkonia sp. F]|uniref:DegV family protein n=1 Tax=Nesterenkonia sp. F TaxID=795955 RepID=UPI000255C7EF|nr:DegV family protein [Nesterenkonia sp. F]
MDVAQRADQRIEQRLDSWGAAWQRRLRSSRRAAGLRAGLRRRRPRVAVVTDSSAALPMQELGPLAEAITVVPIPVMIGEQIHPEAGEELGRDLPLALAQGTRVVTSRPSPGRLAEAYADLSRQGVEHVVSVHLSSALSGTVEAARLAAEQVDVAVEVVDSRQTGMTMGHAVLEAALCVLLGGTAAEAAAAARTTAEASTALFVVPNLEQLRRGGRITALSGLLGTLLSVRPLLALRDGAIQLEERPRSLDRAVERLTARAVEEAAAGTPVRIAVHGFGNAEQALALAESLDEHSAAPVPVVDVPPSLAAHLGLGVLGVCLSPLDGAAASSAPTRETPAQGSSSG